MDWKVKYNLREAEDQAKSCATCSAFKGDGAGVCQMFNNAKVDEHQTCDEWSDSWRKEAAAATDDESEDWVPIIGQGGNEVVRGKPIGGPDSGLYQYVPPERTYSLDEALTDLRDGGYDWRVERGEDPQMWRLQHKREPYQHALSSRDLQLRGYNVYYNDPYLPRAPNTEAGQALQKGSYDLHDTNSGKEFGRIWATQRVDDIPDWQEPEPGALNEPWLRKRHPDLWRKHWGEEERTGRVSVIPVKTTTWFRRASDDLLNHFSEQQSLGQPIYVALKKPQHLELRGGKIPIPGAQPFDVSSEGVPLYSMMDLGWNPDTQQRETSNPGGIQGAPENRGVYVNVPANKHAEVRDWDPEMEWALIHSPLHYPDGSDARLHPRSAVGWVPFQTLRKIDRPRSPFRKR